MNRKAEDHLYGATAEDVAAAEAALARELAGGPRRPRDVKRAAEAEHGRRLPDAAWQQAKRELGVRATDLGRGVWSWSLLEPDFEDALGEWLETPAGRFAVYLAEHDRLGTPAGAHLRLEV